MFDLRLLGASLSALALGGCLLLGWDFDKEPPPAAGGGGGAGGSIIVPADPVVLGQPDGEAQVNLRGGLAGSSTAAICGDRLVVADSYNNRVLIYDPVPSPAETLREPTWVLGQPDASSNDQDDGTESAVTLDYPYAVACRAGGPLAVADGGNYRVLLWNGIPGADQVPADVVVGQDSFEASEPNRGVGVDDRGVGFPGGVAFGDNNRFAVADPDNHRVLLWDDVPTQNGAAADHVVGQSSFAGSSPAAGADRLRLPHGVVFRQGALWVSDFGNNRVLRWNPIPGENGMAADLLLGQPDFDATDANAGAEPGLDGFDGPGWPAFIDDTLFVADWRNARVLVWDDVVAATSSVPADRVIGQPAGSATTPNTPTLSEGSLWTPWGLTTIDAGRDDADRLYIVDESNHRVTSFARDTVNDGEWMALGVVAGQAGGGSNPAMAGGGISEATLHGPVGAATDGQRLVVSDAWAHRVLLWNDLPTDDEAPADVVLGQAMPDEAVGLTDRATADRLYFPAGVALDDERLVVADNANHRVLIWDPVPSDSGAPATVVVGQANFSESSANRGGDASALTLARPSGVDVVSTEDGVRLLVTEAGNDRVLIFDDIPAALDQPASHVLGQTTLSGSGGDLGPTKLDAPTDVVSDGNSIFVADLSNRRVMVWNGFPTSDGVAADFVIGQPDFETSDAGAIINDRTLHQPFGVALSDGYLFVADSHLHRILAFALPITESFPAADFVLGQPDFSSSQQNDEARSALTLASPRRLAAHGDLLVVPEFQNSRALMWRLGAVLD